MYKRILLAFALALVPISVSAAPVFYNITYDGSVAGSPGAGSFLYDDTPGLEEVTSFGWDFGGGQSGALIDFPGDHTFDKLLFDIVSGVNTTVLAGFGPSSHTGFPASGVGTFCDVGASFCTGSVETSPSYRFLSSAGGVVVSGLVSIARADIPEPAALGLIVIGLAGLAFARRRRAA